MAKYRAALFDLFNTVAVWHPERMPRFTINGEEKPSTLGELKKLINSDSPDVDFDAFVDSLSRTNSELARERAHDGRERSSVERFTRALQSLPEGPPPEFDRLAGKLTQRHMAMLGAAVSIPDSHLSFLEQLSSRTQLALVSNFDHAPTAHALLERHHATRLFDVIHISDEHGYRKPHPRIFTDTLSELKVAAGDALFIGDSYADDVIGALQAGIDVAWVNPDGAKISAGQAQPRHIINAIDQLDSAMFG